MERLTFGICCTLLILGTCMSASFAADSDSAPERELVTRPTVGLVLSGSARGAAHVGVIKVLDDLNDLRHRQELTPPAEAGGSYWRLKAASGRKLPPR